MLTFTIPLVFTHTNSLVHDISGIQLEVSKGKVVAITEVMNSKDVENVNIISDEELLKYAGCIGWEVGVMNKKKYHLLFNSGGKLRHVPIPEHFVDQLKEFVEMFETESITDIRNFLKLVSL